MEPKLEIGKIIKPHGVRGILKVFIPSTVEGDFDQLNHIYLSTPRDKMLPYFVEELEFISDNVGLLKLEDVTTKEQAATFKKSAIHVDADLGFEVIEEFTFLELTGYQLLDENKTSIGKIEGVFDLKTHHIAELRINDQEVLIPIQEETVIAIDEDKKEVIVKVPNGLLA